jgi:hypothetical protein
MVPARHPTRNMSWRNCALASLTVTFHYGAWLCLCARYILHVIARRFLWRPDAEVAVNEYPFDIIDTGVFRDSPVARVFATGRPEHRPRSGAWPAVSSRGAFT